MALWSTISQGRAVDSYLVITVSGANDLTLTTDQSVARRIKLSGSLTGNINVFVPVAAVDTGQAWSILNTCTGGTLTVKPSGSGSGVAIATNKQIDLAYNGTDMVTITTDVVAMGAAASGANGDITSMSGITGGVTMYGGLNVGDSVRGNSAQNKAFQFGRLTKALSDANTTLSASEYVNPHLEFTGTLTATRNVVLPLTGGAIWFVWNNGTGQSLQFIGATGVGITVANNKRAAVGSNGVDIIRWIADTTP